MLKPLIVSVDILPATTHHRISFNLISHGSVEIAFSAPLVSINKEDIKHYRYTPVTRNPLPRRLQLLDVRSVGWS